MSELEIEPRFIETKTGVKLRTATFQPHADAPDNGVCVLLHGRSEFIEKYREVIGELCRRGFKVATFDWRGQGGSERALSNPLYGHVEDFAEYDEDLDAFMKSIVEPLECDSPLILSHSMGGNLTLRALKRRPSSFRGAVMTSPMIDVYGRNIARFIIPILNLIGFSKAPFSKGKKSDPLNLTFEENILTSDRERFKRIISELEKNPKLRVGPPTWGWLNAANDSIKSVLSNGFARSITSPVLVFGAGKDRICVTDAAKSFTSRLKSGSYIEIEDSEHEILMEKDDIRSEFWKSFDAFVKSL